MCPLSAIVCTHRLLDSLVLSNSAVRGRDVPNPHGKQMLRRGSTMSGYVRVQNIMKNFLYFTMPVYNTVYSILQIWYMS